MKNDYPTCYRTFATLRVYHDTASPVVVTELLRMRPSKVQTAGQPAKSGQNFRLSGWFLRSEGHVESRDSAKHLRWLLGRIKKKGSLLKKLKTRGWWMDISVYWSSRWGHGGPTIDPKLAMGLGKLGIEFWFDVYCDPQSPDRPSPKKKQTKTIAQNA